MEFEPVIGLEVHVQLQTESKIFCPSSAAFGGPPNSKVDPICLGMPGVLPVLNKRVVEYAVRMGLATHCTIRERSIFARKHYFYPDLPKGYQISQYDKPTCEHGHLDIEGADGDSKRIRIERIHLEEDAGKSVHAEEYVAGNETLIDLNRCGVALIEIVSGPDIGAPVEAARYVSQIRQLVRYLGICDGNMEEGSLRCDANVSVRPRGQKKFGTKTELKNMNTIRGVEKALEYEIARQIDVVRNDGEIHQETRLWDGNAGKTVAMRSKEYAHDYRYFPDPDLVPLVVDEAWRSSIAAKLPELPQSRRRRFVDELALPEYDAAVLTEERSLADYFEQTAQACGDAKLASNWVMGDVMRELKERRVQITELPMQPDALAQLLKLVLNNTISGSIARKVFGKMLETGDSAADIVEREGLAQISDNSAVEKMIDEVIAAHPEEAERFRAGEQKLMGFFVGQVMRASQGKVNPKMANELLRSRLIA